MYFLLLCSLFSVRTVTPSSPTNAIRPTPYTYNSPPHQHTQFAPHTQKSMVLVAFLFVNSVSAPYFIVPYVRCLVLVGGFTDHQRSICHIAPKYIGKIFVLISGIITVVENTCCYKCDLYNDYALHVRSQSFEKSSKYRDW